MTGKEVKDSSTTVTIKLTKEEPKGKHVYLEWETSAGDIITNTILTSVNMDKYVEVVKELWSSANQIQLVGRTLYFTPALYWNCYKRMPGGKAFFSGNNYIMTINGETAYYPTAKFYFSAASPASAMPGIYGIYNGDELLYVEYSGNMIEKWQIHDKNFRERPIPC